MMQTTHSRPDKDTYFLRMALLVAERATCARRRVGCVLVDRHGFVMATGRNGPPSGWQHCIDHPCPGASSAPGEGLDLCEAIHAEQNALLQCRNTQEIDIAYCTDSPCVTCTKLLMNTSCRRIVFVRRYPHARAEDIWRKGNRDWEQVNVLDPASAT